MNDEEAPRLIVCGEFDEAIIREAETQAQQKFSNQRCILMWYDSEQLATLKAVAQPQRIEKLISNWYVVSKKPIVFALTTTGGERQFCDGSHRVIIARVRGEALPALVSLSERVQLPSCG